MADLNFSAIVDFSQGERSYQRFAQKAQRDINKAFSINNKKFLAPLGKIKGGVAEFNSSMDAANARVLAFGASAGAILAIRSALTGLVKTTIDVEKSLADINVVLNVSNKSLGQFSNELFNIAAKTGQSFSAVAEAATELARQGLGVEETQKRLADAMILTRLSGLAAEESVKTLTAAINGFNKEALTSAEIVGRLALVDQSFAVGSDDLAEAIKRVGSAASDANVNFNQLISVVTATQQITSSGGAKIGSSLKTIFTRLQRVNVLSQLEQLGVTTRDAGQNILPAIDILKNYALQLDKLTPAQRSVTSELIGSVFQINQLKAIVRDLSKEYGIYGQALDVANIATTEAIDRNAKLNETISALINETTANVENFASSLGNLAIGPSLQLVLNSVSNVAKAATVNEEGVSLGSKFAQGFLSGLGEALSTSGIVLILAIFKNIAAQFSNTLGPALRGFITLRGEAQRRLVLESNIKDALFQEKGLMQGILAGTISTETAQQKVLQSLSLQVAEAKKLAFTLNSISGAAAGVGFRINPQTSALTQKKGVFNPNFAPSPLSQAIEREKKAGLPKSTIRVGTDDRLASPANPLGLGVFNTKDEPRGLGEGISRELSVGNDPKSSGLQKGKIPNFAPGGFPIGRVADKDTRRQLESLRRDLQIEEKAASETRSKDLDAKVKNLKATLGKGSVSGSPNLRQEQIRFGMSQAVKAVTKLKKEFNLSEREASKIRRSLGTISQAQKDISLLSKEERNKLKGTERVKEVLAEKINKAEKARLQDVLRTGRENQVLEKTGSFQKPNPQGSRLQSFINQELGITETSKAARVSGLKQQELLGARNKVIKEGIDIDAKNNAKSAELTRSLTEPEKEERQTGINRRNEAAKQSRLGLRKRTGEQNQRDLDTFTLSKKKFDNFQKERKTADKLNRFHGDLLRAATKLENKNIEVGSRGFFSRKSVKARSLLSPELRESARNKAITNTGSRLLLGSIIAPLVAESINSVALTDKFKATKAGRVREAEISGAGTAIGLAATGFAVGGPLGGAIGGLAGAFLALTSIVKESSTTFPEFNARLKKSQQDLTKLIDTIARIRTVQEQLETVTDKTEQGRKTRDRLTSELVSLANALPKGGLQAVSAGGKTEERFVKGFVNKQKLDTVFNALSALTKGVNKETKEGAKTTFGGFLGNTGITERLASDEDFKKKITFLANRVIDKPEAGQVKKVSTILRGALLSSGIHASGENINKLSRKSLESVNEKALAKFAVTLGFTSEQIALLTKAANDSPKAIKAFVDTILDISKQANISIESIQGLLRDPKEQVQIRFNLNKQLSVLNADLDTTARALERTNKLRKEEIVIANRFGGNIRDLNLKKDQPFLSADERVDRSTRNTKFDLDAQKTLKLFNLDQTAAKQLQEQARGVSTTLEKGSALRQGERIAGFLVEDFKDFTAFAKSLDKTASEFSKGNIDQKVASQQFESAVLALEDDRKGQAFSRNKKFVPLSESTNKIELGLFNAVVEGRKNFADLAQAGKDVQLNFEQLSTQTDFLATIQKEIIAQQRQLNFGGGLTGAKDTSRARRNLNNLNVLENNQNPSSRISALEQLIKRQEERGFNAFDLRKELFNTVSQDLQTRTGITSTKAGVLASKQIGAALPVDESLKDGGKFNSIEERKHAADILAQIDKDNIEFTEKEVKAGRLLSDSLLELNAVRREELITLNKLSGGKAFVKNFSDALAQAPLDAKVRFAQFGGDLALDIKGSFSNAFKGIARDVDNFQSLMEGAFRHILDTITDEAIDTLVSQGFGALQDLGTKAAQSFASNKQATGGEVKKFASGGVVEGGSGIRDDVPALLNKGEFVIKKSSVEKYGKGLFEGLNSNSADLSFTNQFKVNAKRPTSPEQGVFDVDPNLSAFALRDTNNPQNRIRFDDEEKFFQYLKDFHDFKKAQKDAQKAFDKKQRNTLIQAYISVAAQFAGQLIGGAGGQAIQSGGAQANTVFGPKADLKFSGPLNLTEGAAPSNIGLGSTFNTLPKPQNFGRQGLSLNTFAQGGQSTDTVPSLLTKGEVVINKDAVDKLGVDFLTDLNQGKIGLVPNRFQTGGLVGGATQNQITPNIGNGGSEEIMQLLTRQNVTLESINASLIDNGKNGEGQSGKTSPIINISNNITIESGGGVKNQTETTSQGNQGNEINDRQLAALNERMVNVTKQVIVEESRNGGLLDR